MTSHWSSRLLPLIGPLLLFVLWQLAVSAQWLNPVLLPSPLETLGFMFHRSANRQCAPTSPLPFTERWRHSPSRLRWAYPWG